MLHHQNRRARENHKIMKGQGVYLVNLLPKLSEPVAKPGHGKTCKS